MLEKNCLHSITDNKIIERIVGDERWMFLQYRYGE
jgi:hypothetical protein